MGLACRVLPSGVRSPTFQKSAALGPAGPPVKNARPPGRWRFLDFSRSPLPQGIAPEPAHGHGWAAFFYAFPKAHKRLDGKLNVATKNKGAGGIGTVSTPGAMQSHERMNTPRAPTDGLRHPGRATGQSEMTFEGKTPIPSPEAGEGQGGGDGASARRDLCWIEQPPPQPSPSLGEGEKRCISRRYFIGPPPKRAGHAPGWAPAAA